MTTKRGINLGCGRVTLPCKQPEHHVLIPSWLYTNPDITWDNVDRNAGEGVTHAVNLFDYPWTVVCDVPGGWDRLEDNAYDYAIAAHICEHIPHAITEYGEVLPHHEDYQDGWFYWFSELSRILKPGGKAYILVPYAWSSGAISDPTHTRYLTPASFNYLIPNDDAPFEYKQLGQWEPLRLEINHDMSFTPHQLGVARIMAAMRNMQAQSDFLTTGVVKMSGDWTGEIPDSPETVDMATAMLWIQAQSMINAIADLCIVLTKKGGKDESKDHAESGRVADRTHADETASAAVAR